MTPDLLGLLLQGMQRTGFDARDLWLAAAGIGGAMAMEDVSRILRGDDPPTRADYDVLAAALNDRSVELGDDHPVPYWSELAGTGRAAN